MKMRLEIKSPRRGVVARLPVAAGEQAEGGAVLAVVEASPA
jgi:biotin carboxyl carrier protein